MSSLLLFIPILLMMEVIFEKGVALVVTMLIMVLITMRTTSSPGY